MSEAILLEKRNGVAFVTMNRPERANVLDSASSAQLTRIVDEIASDSSVRAVLLRGSGPHFCAGGDIQGFIAAGDDMSGLLDRSIPPLHDAIHALATLPVPVVSAVNGSLGGGGIGIALCADIVLAGESMKLRGGYSAIGLTPDVGVSWFLTRLVGPMRAKQILFANVPLSARQCLEIGIVAEVHPDAELDGVATALVETLARSASGALARIKNLVDGAGQRSLREQLALEHRSMVESGATADSREGVRAFVEKRAPVFDGGR